MSENRGGSKKVWGPQHTQHHPLGTFALWWMGHRWGDQTSWYLTSGRNSLLHKPTCSQGDPRDPERTTPVLRRYGGKINKHPGLGPPVSPALCLAASRPWGPGQAAEHLNICPLSSKVGTMEPAMRGWWYDPANRKYLDRSSHGTRVWVFYHCMTTTHLEA